MAILASTPKCSSIEAEHAGIENLADLNDQFKAWAEQVANRRTHAETNQTPIGRWQAGGRPRAVDPARLREAFLWAATRRVTRTATVSLEANHYSVGPVSFAKAPLFNTDDTEEIP